MTDDLETILPDQLRVHVEALVADGEFQSSADYVRDLVRQDLQTRENRTHLFEQLDAGMRGPSTLLTEDGMAGLDQRMKALIAEASPDDATPN